MTLEGRADPDELQAFQSPVIRSRLLRKTRGLRGLFGNLIKATKGNNNIRIAFLNIGKLPMTKFK